MVRNIYNPSSKDEDIYNLSKRDLHIYISTIPLNPPLIRGTFLGARLLSSGSKMSTIYHYLLIRGTWVGVKVELILRVG
jgi:hypothetical protein